MGLVVTVCGTINGTGSGIDCLAVRNGGPSRAGQPVVVEAVLYRYRAGVPWRDLPERFGDFRVVHLRHTRWAARGVWQQVLEHLAKKADNEYARIDSAIVRAHQHSAGTLKKGATRPSAAARAG